MKARNELNRSLYSQKANGRESNEKSPAFNDYTVLCRGDTEAAKNHLEQGKISLYKCGRKMSDSAERNLLYSFVTESDRLVSAAVSAGMGHDEAVSLADIYVRRADKGAKAEQLEALYSDMCLDFGERIGEIRKAAVSSLHIRKAISYIYENLNGDLSVKGLASHAGLNPSYFSRLFSQETGTTVKRFVTKAKITTACDLLRYTGLPNIEIAYSLGFSTQSMFIRIFKAETGMTPKKYRDRYSG